MLTLRRRGSAGKWYVRGSVTLGERFVDVPEFSTGTTDEDAARHVMLERERALREELMFGPRVVASRAVIADAFEAYLAKPKRPNSSDILRVGVMNDRIGAMPLTDPESSVAGVPGRVSRRPCASRGMTDTVRCCKRASTSGRNGTTCRR